MLFIGSPAAQLHARWSVRDWPGTTDDRRRSGRGKEARRHLRDDKSLSRHTLVAYFPNVDSLAKVHCCTPSHRSLQVDVRIIPGAGSLLRSCNESLLFGSRAFRDESDKVHQHGMAACGVVCLRKRASGRGMGEASTQPWKLVCWPVPCLMVIASCEKRLLDADGMSKNDRFNCAPGWQCFEQVYTEAVCNW